jgi:hypothetical protein
VFNIPAQTRALVRREPVVMATGLLFLAMTLPTLAGLALDGRTIAGTSVWMKPLKFQLSLAVHVVTVALALGALDRGVREGWAVRAILVTLLAMSLFEGIWITLQGARGLPSHFAIDPFDVAVYALMGIGATLIVLSTALLGALILRYPVQGMPRLVSRAVGIGFIISGVAGLVTGWFIAENNGAMVGGAGTGGVALPVFGWSGTGGDLRVAHFVGLHAAQCLPLLGLALSARKPRIADLALLVTAVLWSAATLGLLIQALAGQPFIPLAERGNGSPGAVGRSVPGVPSWLRAQSILLGLVQEGHTASLPPSRLWMLIGTGNTAVARPFGGRAAAAAVGGTCSQPPPT